MPDKSLEDLPWIIKLVVDEWDTISSAPITFAAAIFLIVTGIWGVLYFSFLGRFSTISERAKTLEEQSKTKDAQIGFLTALFEDSERRCEALEVRIKEAEKAVKEMPDDVTGKVEVQGKITDAAETLSAWGTRLNFIAGIMEAVETGKMSPEYADWWLAPDFSDNDLDEMVRQWVWKQKRESD